MFTAIFMFSDSNCHILSVNNLAHPTRDSEREGYRAGALRIFMSKLSRVTLLPHRSAPGEREFRQEEAQHWSGDGCNPSHAEGGSRQPGQPEGADPDPEMQSAKSETDPAPPTCGSAPKRRAQQTGLTQRIPHLTSSVRLRHTQQPVSTKIRSVTYPELRPRTEGPSQPATALALRV